MEYRYGMCHARGFGPGCQPKEGLLRREDDISGKYYDVIVYNRELTDEEVFHYDLELIIKTQPTTKTVASPSFIKEQLGITSQFVYGKYYHLSMKATREMLKDALGKEFINSLYQMTEEEVMRKLRPYKLGEITLR